MEVTNPKLRIGAKKVPLGLLPVAGKIYGALGMEDGAAKYTAFNWRKAKDGVSYTIYLDALERHIDALREGEDYAPDSKLHHVCHIIAGASILADSIEHGRVNDDRLGSGGPGPALLNALAAQRGRQASDAGAVQSRPRQVSAPCAGLATEALRAVSSDAREVAPQDLVRHHSGGTGREARRSRKPIVQLLKGVNR